MTERWWTRRAALLVGNTITNVHDDGGRPVLVLNGGPTAVRFNEWASEIDAEVIEWPSGAIVAPDDLSTGPDLTEREARLIKQAVARTLEKVAWAFRDEHAAGMVEVAGELDRLPDEDWADLCPVCEEVTCDSGCPLERLRTQAQAS